MSNTPSSRVVMRIRPSALMFVVLVLIIGALLLASNSIDPRSAERAKFTDTPQPSVPPTQTVDVFTVDRYVSWKSPDGLVQLEHPASLIPQPSTDTTYGYNFVPPDRGQLFVDFLAEPTVRFGSNVVPTTTPEELLKLAFANQPQDQPPVDIKPVQAAGLQGARAHYVTKLTDQSTGQSVPLESEAWALALDPTHILLIRAQVNTGDWPKMQPILDHMTSTLKVDAPGLVKVLDAKSGAATATAPAQAGTSAATQAAPGTAPATATTM